FLGDPRDALAAVADPRHQRPERGEARMRAGIVAFDDGDLRRRSARLQLAFAALPVAHLEGLRELGRRVVHHRREHDVALDTEMSDAQLAELLREALVDLPVAARL